MPVPSIITCPLCGIYGALCFKVDPLKGVVLQCDECMLVVESPDRIAEAMQGPRGIAALPDATKEQIIHAGLEELIDQS